MQPPPERLGSFYLGAAYDLERGNHTGIPVNYDARDLTTHALCVGMTGSGKTGLGLGLLEEAAIDDIPAILIDVKGDISNLVLQFPDLSPQDYAPWVSPEDAQREGLSPGEYAANVAARWKQGMEDWGMSPERIKLLKESVDFTIYTPGSDAGVPINILGSLAAPGLNYDDHLEILRERINGTVNALLGFVGVPPDPVQSRETILLAAIFEHYWRQNQDLDLTKLILALQNPPVRQLGVLDVDTFFPEKDRFELAMAFNNLLASPKFQNWLAGEALEIDKLLYSADGKARHSIFYLAHLSPQERMFLVTLLLESLLAWVRSQSGTESLRAILFFDEVYGYLPPVAQPPSKSPLMGLLKQSRAVGLGCVLATQNPADLDYKALTNTGTWFIGRLQTERDKARVLEGLKGAIAESGGDSQHANYEQIIGQLGPRTFLMHNVHEERPVVFETRWVMCYLHGPLTRPQIQSLMADRKEGVRASAGEALPPLSEPAADSQTPPAGLSRSRQVLEPEIAQVFLPATLSETDGVVRFLGRMASASIKISQVHLVYKPAILGAARIRFFDRKQGISEQRERVLLAPAPDRLGSVDWGQAQEMAIPLGHLEVQPAQTAPERGPFFAPAPEGANSGTEFKRLARDFEDWSYFNSQLTLLSHPELGVSQLPGEAEQQFKIRLRQAARERRDHAVDRLRKTYAGRMEKLEDRLRREQRELERDRSDYSARRREALIATGEMLFTLIGRRRLYRSVSWSASRGRLAKQAKLELEDSREEIEALETELSDLQGELEREITRITPKWVDILKGLTAYHLHPRRSDVEVSIVGLAWVPVWAITYADRDKPGSLQDQTFSATLAAGPIGTKEGPLS
jgi:hypothetical protein